MLEFGGLQKHEHIQHAPWVTKRDTVAAVPCWGQPKFHNVYCDSV